MKMISRHFQLGIVLAGLILAPPLLLVHPAHSQSTSPGPNASTLPSITTATYGDWTLRCVTLDEADRSRSCEIVLTVQVQGHSQPIAQLALGRLPGQTELIMTAVLPVNVALARKVHVSGNAKTGPEEKGGIDLSWTRCLRTACFAEARPGEADLDVLRAEPAGTLAFEDAAGRMITLPLSWRGISQALVALNADSQARNASN